MLHAIELAKMGEGRVSPNPMVGALIVRDGEIIAEGWHQQFGSPHAEVNAIKNANVENFEDCDIYVSLEPCSHHGKQPPCVDEIIKRRFKRVIIGMGDPNPQVNGRGIRKLLENNIDVINGVSEKQCQELNRQFITNMTEKRTFVTLKFASSIDGYLASPQGLRDAISCEESRLDTHKFRAISDAILVGRTTVEKDDPALDARLVQGRNPKRLVLDTQLKLSTKFRLFSDENRQNTYICCDEKLANSEKADAFRALGVNIVPCKLNTINQIDLQYLLETLLKEHNIGNMIVEGGSGVFKSFIDSGLYDDIIVYQAPLLLGAGLKIYDNPLCTSMADAKRLEIVSSERINSDIKLILRKIK